MIGEIDIKKDETGFKKQLRVFLNFIKRTYGRIILAFLTFVAVSSIIYFSANTTDSITNYAIEEYEVGQISDKTIIAIKTMKSTAAYPIELEEGEKIVKKGFPITEEALLKLKKMADAPVTIDYRSVGNNIFFLVLVAALWIILFSRVILGKEVEMRELILEAFLFVLAYFLTSFAYKTLIFQSPYRINVVITSTLSVFLVAILFGQRSAFLYTFVLSSGILNAANFQIVPFIFTLASGLSAARIVRKIEKRIDIVFASILQAVLSVVFIIVLKVVFNEKLNDAFLVLPGVAVNAFLSGILVLGLLTPLENVMNTASVFRLMDLSDTNTAILQKMLINANGTYSHSMMVAQLAENACKRIGANALLARVASYYHDIGKIDQSEYFTENQEGEAKHKHDTLNPSISASIIKSHVKKGLEEAKKLHLPSQVVDIISEHHGNSVIYYFYSKAKESDPSVSESDFSYPGNPPVTRESAVVMLADTVEAACRSLDNPSVSRLEKFIQTLIDGKINGHQLERCGLTFGEISLIKESFVQILAGHYHSRIKYPNQKDPDEQKNSKESEETSESTESQNEEKTEISIENESSNSQNVENSELKDSDAEIKDENAENANAEKKEESDEQK